MPAAPAPSRSAVTLAWRRPWMALGVDTCGAALLAAVGFEAVPRAEVALVDGQDLFWWGIRTPAALTRLAAHLG